VRPLVSDPISGAELRDRIPFVKEMGMELLLGDNGRAKLAIEVLPQHLNGWGAVHGGVTMTVLDVAMAVAARSLEPDGKGVVTIEMKTSFLQAGPPQGRLVATGLCVHRSSSLAFCEAEVRDEVDRLVARATGTFKFLRRREEELST
jgi:acyl-CoA thioesterase